mmetsp:Transcript_59923/g.117516  ORF Transcript_59923/g.117516 Transcript_59923/m.117516 type:complete len:217 (+) Transcript_59923:126-776(+)
MSVTGWRCNSTRGKTQPSNCCWLWPATRVRVRDLPTGVFWGTSLKPVVQPPPKPTQEANSGVPVDFDPPLLSVGRQGLGRELRVHAADQSPHVGRRQVDEVRHNSLPHNRLPVVHHQTKEAAAAAPGRTKPLSGRTGTLSVPRDTRRLGSPFPLRQAQAHPSLPPSWVPNVPRRGRQQNATAATHTFVVVTVEVVVTAATAAATATPANISANANL